MEAGRDARPPLLWRAGARPPGRERPGLRDFGLECSDGAEGLLDQLHGTGARGGFHFAALVGVGGNHTDCLRELVDRVPE
jgi:hypothetical protein